MLVIISACGFLPKPLQRLVCWRRLVDPRAARRQGWIEITASGGRPEQGSALAAFFECAEALQLRLPGLCHDVAVRARRLTAPGSLCSAVTLDLGRALPA